MQSVRQDFELMCLNALVFNKVRTHGLSAVRTVCLLLLLGAVV